jgi:hypothetical protein
MRAKEFIVEARPENIGQGILDKLKKTYLAKEHHNSAQMQMRLENENYGLNIANAMFNAVGPDYLIWVAKQYNQDPNFFLENLPEWKDTLTEFSNLAKDKRVEIERDINKYANIDQLRDVIHVASGSKQELGSPFYSKVIGAMNQFVEEGQASWLYRSPEYSIYYPKTFEASNICKTVMSTNVCTIMNRSHFDTYSKYGTLMYIVNQDRLYNCYISKEPDRQASEFADQENNHAYKLPWMLEHFPALKPLVKKACGPKTELDVKLLVTDPKEQAALINQIIADDPRQFAKLPNDLKTPELAMKAVEGGVSLNAIPRAFFTPEMLRLAVENYPRNIQYVPDELETEELVNMALGEDPTLLAYVSEQYRTPEHSMRAVEADPSLLEYVPEEYLTMKMCVDAVTKDESAFKYVPEEFKTPEFFKALGIHGAIVNMSDNEINHVMEQIKEATNSVIQEAVWSAMDNDIDGYDSWVNDRAEEKGYLLMPDDSPWPNEPYENTEDQNEWLTENDIELYNLENDDERIGDDPDFRYEEYNDSIKEWADKMHEMLDSSSDEIRDAAEEMTNYSLGYHDELNIPNSSMIPDIVANMMDSAASDLSRGRYYNGYHDGDDVSKFLRRRVHVNNDDFNVTVKDHNGKWVPVRSNGSLNENASVGGTSSGSIATVSQPIGGMNRRVQNSSLLSGLLTDEEYPNTPDWIKKSKKIWNCKK